MLVKAIKPGYYGKVYRFPGSTFEVEEKEFSDKWMEKVQEPVRKEKAEKPESDLPKPKLKLDKDVKGED